MAPFIESFEFSLIPDILRALPLTEGVLSSFDYASAYNIANASFTFCAE